MMPDQEQLKFEHRDRVVDACGLAIKHAALLLSPAMQQYADEIIRNNDPWKRQCKKPQAHGSELSLLYALKNLSSLRKTNAWVSQRHYIGVLHLCWCGVAELRDKELRNLDGSLGLAEQEFQQTVVKPLIQKSFETLWAAQAALKKSRKSLVSVEAAQSVVKI
jgi:hypothetical protein